MKKERALNFLVLKNLINQEYNSNLFIFKSF